MSEEIESAYADLHRQFERAIRDLTNLTGMLFDQPPDPVHLRIRGWFGVFDWVTQARLALAFLRRLLNGDILQFEPPLDETTSARFAEHLTRTAREVDQVDFSESVMPGLFELRTALSRLDGGDLTDVLNVSSSTPGYMDHVAEFQAVSQGFRRMQTIEPLVAQAEYDDRTQRTAQRQIATGAINRAFKESAAGEGSAANWFRGLALLTFVASVGLAIWFAVHYRDLKASSEIVKIATVVPLLILGGYLASESRQHRTLARRDKYWAILLETLDPFVAELGGNDQRLVVLQMATQLFRTPTADSGADIPPDALPQITSLIQSLKS